jgi:hypothetical protein
MQQSFFFRLQNEKDCKIQQSLPSDRLVYKIFMISCFDAAIEKNVCLSCKNLVPVNTSAYVSIRPHTSKRMHASREEPCPCQHVSIRQYTSAYVRIRLNRCMPPVQEPCHCQHVSIRQHMSTYMQEPCPCQTHVM